MNAFKFGIVDCDFGDILGIGGSLLNAMEEFKLHLRGSKLLYWCTLAVNI